MPVATIRRSLLRGLTAALLMAVAASSSIAQEPTVLHVVRDPGTAETAPVHTD